MKRVLILQPVCIAKCFAGLVFRESTYKSRDIWCKVWYEHEQVCRNDEHADAADQP